MVKAVSPGRTRRNHWAGDTSLVGAGVGSNPSRNQIFLITFDLALDLEQNFIFTTRAECHRHYKYGITYGKQFMCDAGDTSEDIEKEKELL